MVQAILLPFGTKYTSCVKCTKMVDFPILGHKLTVVLAENYCMQQGVAAGLIFMTVASKQLVTVLLSYRMKCLLFTDVV